MESEHAPVPQPELAAPSAAPAVGGGMAPGPISAPMTAARVLTLPRAAGNAAVTSMLHQVRAREGLGEGGQGAGRFAELRLRAEPRHVHARGGLAPGRRPERRHHRQHPRGALQNSGDVFEGFATRAEAEKRTPQELLNWIHKAKQYDPASYANIVAALDAKAPGITVDITCDTTHVNIGKDVLSASVLRDGTSEAFGSASTLQPGTVLKVELYVTKNNWEVGHGFMSPFSGSSPQLTPGDGRYKIAVSL